MTEESGPDMGSPKESKIQKPYSNMELVDMIMKKSTILGAEEMSKRLKGFLESLEKDK
ncbi:hypothetical protein KKG24_04085 [Patescibacteria group bacterium]|nr:hypothetical protein [Patescibacteria group bacterium]